ncbi:MULTISPECIES: hypothetical protein [Sphingobacterium]|uniref:hypothetical protein n=1 Tax=Sphingobacterium TaxID=28453 RepID=UPI00257C1C85|nr:MULTISPECIES: hypothetical protein [Sphingobacterium]
MKIQLLIPSLVLLISCGLKSPSSFNALEKRNIVVCDALQIEGKTIYGDLQNDLEAVPYTKSLKPADFGDKLYQIASSSVERYYLKESNQQVHYWDVANLEHHMMDVSKKYPFGLVIGQDEHSIYFYNSSTKGKSFGTYNLVSEKLNIVNFDGYTVISTAKLGKKPDVLLSTGVKDEKLGFYLIDTLQQTQTLIKAIETKDPVNGDPGVYGGKFYVFQDRILYVFDNRLSFYEFDQDGRFVREITTIDTFDFKGKSNKAYNIQLEGLYKGLEIFDNILYVRTNIISTKNSYILYDRYDLVEGKYKDSFKLNFDFDISQYSYPIFTNHLTADKFSLIFGDKYRSGRYAKITLFFKK